VEPIDGVHPIDVTPSRTRLRLASRIEADLAKRRSAENLAATAVVRLTANKPEEAVELLQEAHALAPQDPRIANDFAVALVLAHPGNPLVSFRALDLLRNRFAGEQLMPWLWHNRGLALQRSGLAEEARLAFEAARRIEPAGRRAAALGKRIESLHLLELTTTWADARVVLTDAARQGDRDRLRQVVRRWTLAARDEVEEEVLGAWGASVSSGRSSESDRHLRAARAIAAVLAEQGDFFVRDAIAAIQNRSAGAYQDYRDARRGQLSGEYEQAETKAAAAARAFHEAGSPFAVLADRVAATSLYQQGQLDRALAETDVALRNPIVIRYPSVRGRWLWLRGLCLVGRGRPAEGLAAYDSARDSFEPLADAEAVALSETFAAETLNHLGQSDEAARRLTRAMRLSAPLVGRVRLQVVPSELATLCARRGWLQAALAFQDLCVRLNRGSSVGYAEGYALMERSRILERARLQGAANADLRRAEALWQALPSGALRERMRADLALTKGAILLGSDPRQAERLLSDGLRYFEGIGRAFQPLGARYSVARAVLAQGDERRAMKSLQDNLSSRETLRAALRSESQRQSFFDEAEAFFDDLVTTAFRNGNLEGAFEASERSRARVLLDRIADESPVAATVGTTVSVAALRRRLPPTMAIVEYYLSHEGLLAIVVGPRGLSSRLLCPRRKIVEAVESAERKGGDLDAPLARLYDLLLRPLEVELSEAHDLVIVPHRELSRVPFASLLDERSGRFLIEEKVVTLAPSASIALAVPAERHRSRGRTASLIVFADPLVDPRDAPADLEALDAARIEADSVAAEYEGAVVRRGPQATLDAFLAEAPRYEVVHLAMHARENPLLPGRSYLAFARSRPQAPGLLTAETISGLRFSTTGLVVLAACDGAKGEVMGSEGPMSLARAFLFAGVPAVVASLAPIEDRPAAAFFRAFHRRFASGQQAAEALRGAQIEMLRSADPALRSPDKWGSYQLIGRAPELSRKGS